MKRVVSYLKKATYAALCICTVGHPYAYLPDGMSLSNTLLVNAHNSASSLAYGWRYAQQKGTLRQQWNAGARGMKINLHWRTPLSFAEHMAELSGRQLDSAHQKLQEQQQASQNQSFLQKIKSKAVSGLQSVTKVFAKKPSDQKTEPFIALCHEEDTGGNCMLSAYVQKAGEVDKAFDYLKEFATLMKENPDDIAVIIFDDYLNNATDRNGASIYNHNEIQKKLDGLIESSGLSEYALKIDGNKYFAHNGKQPALWPTIGEMRASNKRLILFTINTMHALNSPYLNPFNDDVIRRAHWEYDAEGDLGKSCRLLNNSNATLFMISHGTEASIQTGTVPSFALSILKKFGFNPKAPGGGAIKGTNYKELNSEKNIRQRITDCQKASSLTPVAIIGLDFLEEGNVYDTIKKINLERALEQGQTLRN
jgi:hypothetical protein